jgi:hypothetical protein
MVGMLVAAYSSSGLLSVLDVMAAGLAGRCPGRKQAACAGAGQAGGRRQARLLRKLSLRDMAQRVAFTDESGLTSITSSPLAAQP